MLERILSQSMDFKFSIISTRPCWLQGRNTKFFTNTSLAVIKLSNTNDLPSGRTALTCWMTRRTISLVWCCLAHASVESSHEIALRRLSADHFACGFPASLIKSMAASTHCFTFSSSLSISRNQSQESNRERGGTVRPSAMLQHGFETRLWKDPELVLPFDPHLPPSPSPTFNKVLDKHHLCHHHLASTRRYPLYRAGGG
mmetsp:Transcript_11891/g.32852  ORF Transcript_11891/g.32852 Transcript_11891/m.32852 type:complete len:200 (+) Transcript_11891:1145-1744(+)